MIPTNCIKIIDSGKLPEYMIYEHNSKILVFKIDGDQLIGKSDPMYSMFSNISMKVIDARNQQTKQGEGSP